MSSSSYPAPDASAGSAGVAATHDYRLSDDLARLCLPQEWKDSCRTLAWVNSVCCLFLIVGLVGLKPPKIIRRPLKEVAENVPVIFTPPEEPPKTEPDVKPDEPDKPPDNPQDIPQVATIVAAADPSSVAFPVPIQGAVAIASQAQPATPPPINTHVSAPKFTQFSPNGSTDGGIYPDPEYSMQAQRRGYQGKVILHIMVDPSGTITSVELFKSSGFTLLDEAAIAVVKHKWRFPPGGMRNFEWECTFKPLGG